MAKDADGNLEIVGDLKFARHKAIVLALGWFCGGAVSLLVPTLIFAFSENYLVGYIHQDILRDTHLLCLLGAVVGVSFAGASVAANLFKAEKIRRQLELLGK